jgi:hypothetical protein
MTVAIGAPDAASHIVITRLAPSPSSGIVDRVSTPSPPPPPDTEDLRGLARSLRLLLEIGVRTLSEDSGPSELALRVTGHLGCEHRHQRVVFRSRFAAHRRGVPGPASSRHRECLEPAPLASRQGLPGTEQGYRELSRVTGN